MCLIPTTMGPQKMPRLLQSNHDGVEEAAARIEAGGVVAFPTETVYGLGASTFAVEGLKMIYEIKGRPSDNPLIAHVLDAVEARTLVSGWDLRCSRLAAKFWPGPLTMILNKAIDVPDEATAGLQTIAVRSPMHPVARALLYAVDGPISAPSANRSGHISPTTTEHVMADFPEQEDFLVLEGGRANFGIESTVLDLTGEKPVIRRPGSITLEALARVLGAVEVAQGIGQGVSPGTRLIHYAPKIPTMLVPSNRLESFLATLTEPAAVLTLESARVSAPHIGIQMQTDASAYARMLYSKLREAENSGLTHIVIEEPQGQDGLWFAVLDRLRRAAASV
ncbi:MAG: threonylcarbamoyl-AMP synthase [Planctomycetota bacterium]|nr:MAG: threonylcarbamoyl-AMP synthase [Planctomycetota bacterium]